MTTKGDVDTSFLSQKKTVDGSDDTSSIGTSSLSTSVALLEGQRPSKENPNEPNAPSDGRQQTKATPSSSTRTRRQRSPSHSTSFSNQDNQKDRSSSSQILFSLRVNYLVVILAIMLADGLQGTHLYVLYESYGVSVASLFSLGFVAGAVATPLTGPLIDKFGRRRSALLYCVLEMAINRLEQYPWYWGLVISRVVGGITTNLLHSVFEAWLDTELQRQPGSAVTKDYYGLLLRDAMVVSNLAAIGSGCLAHVLAEQWGPVGPFQGAVTCTGVALVVIWTLWTENYGSSNTNHTPGAIVVDIAQGNTEVEEDVSSLEDISEQEVPVGEPSAQNAKDEDSEATSTSKFHDQSLSSNRSILLYLKGAIRVFFSDSRVFRVGIIQGFTGGSLQIFIFLWSPTLQEFSKAVTASKSSLSFSDGIIHNLSIYWLDSAKEPAYGLIFGAFMAAGVLGGLCSPFLRKLGSRLVAPSRRGIQRTTGTTNTTTPSNLSCASPTKGRAERTPTQDNNCPANSAKSLVAGAFLSSSSSSSSSSKEDNELPMAVEFLASICYFVSVLMLLVPCFIHPNDSASFGLALLAFLIHEFSIGVVMPCEGVIRSLYMPADDRATMMTFPRMIVNLAVSLGVLLTNHFSARSSFAVVAVLMAIACILQLSLISIQEWKSLWGRLDRHLVQPSRRLSSRMMLDSASSSFLSTSKSSLGTDESIHCEASSENDPTTVVGRWRQWIGWGNTDAVRDKVDGRSSQNRLSANLSLYDKHAKED